MSFYMEVSSHDDYNAITVDRQADRSLWISVHDTGDNETVVIPADRVDEFLAGLTQEVAR